MMAPGSCFGVVVNVKFMVRCVDHRITRPLFSAGMSSSTEAWILLPEPDTSAEKIL
jgi:hypothetical protein